ncbi:McrC family protein [Dyadobacter sp. OTU695]|uniref:McrC family protein n=1 Tax=Dyadobacter sp. OTU695 TaxID=3043860 RepID=UPI00313ECDED
MRSRNKHITVFEHQCLRLNDRCEDIVFDQSKLHALQSFYGTGVPYFSLIHHGVRFNEHVGVIQVGDLVVEILPKADRRNNQSEDEAKWRKVLIGMLLEVDAFNLHAPTSAALHLKANSVLDLFFQLFISEVEYLLHSGLVKKYRRKEGNVTALKGNLIFGKHIQQNLTHQERFYVGHTVYDPQHKLHAIVYKTIRLLKHINTSADLHSHIGNLLLGFPEMADISVSAKTFETVTYNRKTEPYRKCIEIARLILLQYHPDVTRGRNHVLALMFDMNLLWEKFVYKSLRKHIRPETTITVQSSKSFWKPDRGMHSRIRPDIVIDQNTEHCMVIDTKWKNLNGSNPSPDDLRQMYVYHQYFGAKRVGMIYPGPVPSRVAGVYLPTKVQDASLQCSLIGICVDTDLRRWQKAIYNEVAKWSEN